MWRRVWDSNPRAQRANGFQDRLVMTTSITLRRLSLAKCSGIWREFRERTMKFLYDGKCRKPLILQGFWGNKRNFCARVFKTASLWPRIETLAKKRNSSSRNQLRRQTLYDNWNPIGSNAYIISQGQYLVKSIFDYFADIDQKSKKHRYCSAFWSW